MKAKTYYFYQHLASSSNPFYMEVENEGIAIVLVPIVQHYVNFLRQVLDHLQDVDYTIHCKNGDSRGPSDGIGSGSLNPGKFDVLESIIDLHNKTIELREGSRIE